MNWLMTQYDFPLPGQPSTMQPLWGETTFIQPSCHFFL